MLVGNAEAKAVLTKVPDGQQRVYIKGDPGDPNGPPSLPKGWDDAGLKDKVASGDIKILGPAEGTFTDAWKTEEGPVQHGGDHRQGAVSDGNKIDAILAGERQHGARASWAEPPPQSPTAIRP